MTRLDWFAGLGLAWGLTAATLAAQGGTSPAIDQLELRGVPRRDRATSKGGRRSAWSKWTPSGGAAWRCCAA